MKKEKDKVVIITPRKLQQLRLGLKERTKVRDRKEKERREQYYK